MGEMLNGSGTGCGELVRQAVGTGSAGPCLRSQEGSGKGGFSRFARGEGLFAFNARSGTVPLPLGVLWGQATPLKLGTGSRGQGFIGCGLERGRLWFRLWP
jgi:hypothetical protein